MVLVLFCFLLTTAVNCNQLSCFSHFNACSVVIIKPNLTVDAVNNENVARFCEDMTNMVIPCIAEKMEILKGNSLYGRATTLVRCYETTNKDMEPERQQFLKVTKLYLYACVYNNMIDMTRSRCFEHILKKCVETKPNKQECYYWNCALDNDDDELRKRRPNAHEMFLTSSSMSQFRRTAFVITFLIIRYLYRV